MEDLIKFDNHYRLRSVINNLDYLNDHDLKELKLKIKEKLFFNDFNKKIPDIFRNKILKINFKSYCYEYYKGAKINSTIELLFINNHKIQTGCKYFSYYDHKGDVENEDINEFIPGNFDIDYMGN
ncbi:hypothetical protein QLL95_gp0980 [Cotonvirus japonicus]|uniref:Uncharacterized protein n=1 Tax=Cotonvirus japonicus TaxID=2811091 RepID=A0ABM7NSM2_9VIRU|nr:hypothetical protein QLL95_gp0980 [Cotonvirus japonicus]BCS83143.1 hypothetical protein [Cotonvirus japonicus]